MLEQRRLDPLLIDVGAVERTGVEDLVSALAAQDLRMSPRHRDVIQHDLGVGMTSDTGRWALKAEPGARQAPRAHDEHTGASGDLRDGNLDVV